jgi:glycosyltransferase involved in cell wall biosynthesis
MVISISLVMTVYNRERYLGNAIKSILRQTRGDFELLVWDHGSTDRSVEIARHYAQIDPRIRFIAAGRDIDRVILLHKAHAEAIGTYVACVDSDDILAPTALEATTAILDTRPEIGVVYTDYQVIDENNKIKGLGNRCRIPYSKERLLIDFMTFHFRILRRSLYNQIGGFDYTIPSAEDYDLCLKLSEITEFYHLQQSLYYYRQHAASVSSQNRLEQIESAHQAIARAIERRGMSDSHEVSVELVGRFSLRPKKT